MTITGAINDAVPTVSNTLTKVGGGDLALAGANTYAGVTLVSAGNLIVQNPSALGAAGTPGTQVLVLQNAVANITSFKLSYNVASAPTTAVIPYTGNGASDAAAIAAALGSAFLPTGGTVVSVTADATDTMFTIVLGGTLTSSVQPLLTVSITAGTGTGFAAEAGSTWITAGSALELESSLNLEPITLNGNGILPPNNGHYTGALVNVANNHSYTGTITFNTNSTIGVTSGALTIDPASPANGIIDGGTASTAYSLTKEGTGTLILASPDTYQGNTYITTGVLEVENNDALGSGTITIVDDGAQLELQKPTGSTGLTIPATDTLYLSGIGVGTTNTSAGALRNQGGANAWLGLIYLSSVPNYSSATSPEGVVAIYVDPGDSLTLANTIAEGLPPIPTGGAPTTVGTPASSGLAEVGTGTLVLAGNNSFSGGTYVGYTFGNVNNTGVTAAGLPGGVIDAQNANALGTDQNAETQRIVTYDPPGGTDQFTLTFNGQTTPNLSSGTTAATIQSDLNALSSIGLSATGTTTAGSAVVTALQVGGLPLSSISQLQVGMPVTGAHLTGGPYFIASIQSISQITLNTGVGVTAGSAATIGLGAVTVTSATVYNGLNEVQTVTLNNPTSLQNSPATLTATAGSAASNPGANLNPSMILSGTTTNNSFSITGLPNTDTVQNGTLTSGANVVTGLASTSTLFLGEPVSGTGIPANAIILAINGATSITLSANATASGTNSLTFAKTNLYVGEPISGPGIPANSTIATISSPTPTSITFTNATNSKATASATVALTFTQTYFYEVTAVTPLGESVPTAQQSVATSAIAVMAGATTSNSFAVTLTAGSAGSLVGMLVSGPGIPLGTTVTANTAGSTSVTLSNKATATGSGVLLTFTPASANLNLAANLSWATVPGATSYNIYRSLNSGDFAQAKYVTVSAPATTFTDIGPVSLSAPTGLTATTITTGAGGNLTPSVPYYYVVTAVGLAGETLASFEATATTGTAVSANLTINLAWNPVLGATSYNIYRTQTSGDYADALLASTTNTAYADNGSVATLGDFTPPTDTFAPPSLLAAALGVGGTLEPATSYYYAVTSVGPNGESIINTYSKVTTGIAAVGELKVALTWTPEDSATGYNIYRSTLPINQSDLSNDRIAHVNGGTATGYTDSGATLGVQGTMAAASAVITAMPSTILLAPGMSVTGTNLTGGPYYIVSVNSATSITLNTGTGVTAGTGTLNFNAISSATPPTQTKFSVSFNAVTSPSLSYTGNASTDAANIQSALQALTSIGAGNVIVSADPTDTVFTITFQSAMSDAQESLVSATILQSTASASSAELTAGNGGASYVYTVHFVGGAALTPLTAQPLITINKVTATSALIPGSSEVATGGFTTLVYTGSTLALDGDPTNIGHSVTLPTSTTIALNGPGFGNEGALYNASGNNTLPWNPNSTLPQLPTGSLPSIILQSSSSIGAAANTQLYVTGTVADPSPESNTEPIAFTDPTTLPSSLTKVGTGTVTFNPAATTGNTYTGVTNVNAGDLNIQSAHALGYNTSAVQDILVGTTGTFKLDFNSATLSASIPVSSSAATVQAAINALPNISVGGGSVTVSKSGNHFYVYFNNPAGTPGSDPLAYIPQNLLGFQNTGTGVISLTTLIPGGASTTNVGATGGAATLQLQNAAGNGSGFIESSGKALNLSNAGFTGNSAPINLTGTTASGSPVITNISSTSQLAPGMAVSGANIPAGAVIVSVDSATQVTLNLNATAAGNSSALAFNAVSGALENVLGANTWGSSSVTLATNSTIGVDDTSTLIISQPIGDAGLGLGITKLGTGTLQYTGNSATNNTYTGTTNVLLGTLNLAKTNNGTALNGNLYAGSPDYVQQTQTLTFNNFANGDTYKLIFDGQTTGTITYLGGATADATSIASFLNNLAFVTANFASGSTPFSVTQVGATNSFTVTLGGVLNGSAWPQILGYAVTAASGAGTIGTILGVTSPAPAGALNSVIVNELAGSTNEIVASATVTIVDDGVLNLLTGAQQAVAALYMTSGDMVLANGSILTLAGPGLTAPISAGSDATGMAIIQEATTPDGTGEINMGAGGHLFTVTHGGSANVSTDLDISVIIAGTAGNAVTALTKNGDGRLELSNQDAYGGLTQINNGDIQVDSLQEQIITFGGSVANNNTFTLTYNDPSANGNTVSASPITTGSIIYASTGATTASRIQDALNQALVGSTSGPVTVTVIGSGVFSVAFAGVFGINVIPLTLTGTSGNFSGTFINTISNIGNVVLAGGGSLSGSGSVGTGSGTTPAIQGPTAPSTPVTAASWAGNVATLTAANTFSVGQTVVVSGVTPTGYDGIFTVAAATPTTFSYALTANPGAGTAFGAAALVGTVNPGANGQPLAPGAVQTTGNAAWTSTTQFSVDLTNTSNNHPTPVIGSDYDTVFINGNVNLGSGNNANTTSSNLGTLLTGSVGANIEVGDSFTILQVPATDTITGNFTEMIHGVQVGIGPQSAGFATDSLFIGLNKFYVTYNAHSVVLTRALINDTVIVTPITNPAYGQNVTYTATVVPELGAPVPDTATNDPTASVTFTDAETGETYTAAVTNGTATFQPETQSGATGPVGLWATDSQHQITADFGDASVYSAGASYPASFTGTTSTGSPTVTITGAGLGAQTLAAGMSVSGPGIPAGASILSVVGSTVTLNMNATASETNVPLNVGPQYVLTGTTVSGSTAVTGLLNTSALAVGMSVTGTGIPPGDSIASITSISSITLAAPASSSGSPVSLTFGPVWAMQMPGDTTLNGTSIQNLPSTNQLVAGMAVTGPGIPANTFIASIAGLTSITLTNPATASAASANLIFAQVVQNGNVQITTTLPATSIYGQPQTFTVTISSNPATGVPGALQPTVNSGTVSISIDGGAAILPTSVSGQVATFTLPTTLNVSANPHTVTISYTGDANYNANTSSPALNIIPRTSQITITPTPAISSLGQSVTFGIQVSPVTPPAFAGNAAEGTVNVYDGDPTLAPTTTTAVFNIPGLLGAPVQIAVASTAGMTPGQFLYISDGTHSIVASISSIVDSTHLMIQTGTILAGSAGNAMASGANVLLSGLLDPATTSSLFAIPSVGNQVTINVASTTWIKPTEYLNISDGTNTIIAQVISTGNGTVTIQTVEILAGTGPNMAASAAVELATDPSTGLATFITSGLAFGTHQIYAVFTDGGYTGADLDYAGGTANDASSSFTVQAGTTISSFTANPVEPPGTDVFGQTVTLTATVTSSAGVPTAGQVDFYDGAVTSTSSSNYLGSGTVTLVTTPITAASWSASAGGTATISAANSYAVGQSVLISGVTPSAYDGNFTILSATSGGFTFALPLGSNPGSGTAFGTAAIGKATLATNVLSVGTHTLSAQYNDVAPNNNYGQSPTKTINPYVVSAANSKVTVTDNTPSTTINTVGGFVIPAVGGSVTTNVASVAGLAVNQYVYISDGAHTVAAQITGFGAGTAVTFQTDTLVLGNAGSTMANGATVLFNVPIYGNALTFTATVTAVAPGSDPTPTGTVTFSDSLDGPLGAGVQTGPNTWTFTILATQFIAGTHVISANYSGDGNLSGANSIGPNPGTLAYVVAPAATTVSTPILTSPAGTPVYGQPITLQATVTGNVPGTPGNPTTGKVTFKDGTTTLGAVDLSLTSTNVAILSLTSPTLAAGATHNITATYTPPAAATMTGATVNASTTVTVSSTASLSAGMFVTGAGIPGGTTIAAIVSGTSFTLSQAATASASVSLSFGADFSTSVSGALAQSVNAAQTSVTVSSSTAPANSVGLNQSVTYTASIVTVAPSSGAPATAGTVTFYDVAPIPLTTTKAAFIITAVGASTGAIPVNATTGMAVGNLLEITDGTSVIVGSISSIVANTSVTLTTSAVLAGSVGGTMSTAATVSPATKLNSTPISVNASGQASVAVTYTATSALGAHAIWANYSPPTTPPINYAGSVGELTETVLKASAVTVSAVTNTWGQQLVYTVKVASPQSGNPSGTVTAVETVSLTGATTSASTTVTVPNTAFLTNGMTVIGAGIPANTTITVVNSTTITLSNAATVTASNATLTFTIQRGNVGTLAVVAGVSQATITIPADTLIAGAHSLKFTYVDSTVPPIYAQSSTTISQTVAAAATTVALVSSAPGTSEIGQALTFTATLAVTATNPPGTPGLPASGTVTFKNGTATLATVTLTGSSASSGPVTVTYGTNIVVTYTTVGLALGAHSITAVYSGSAPASPNFSASNTAVVAQTVAAHGSLGTLAPLAWTVGQPYPTTAKITYTRGGNISNAVSVSTAPPNLTTTSTASFVIPAINGATVNMSVASSTGYVAGQYLSITSGTISIGALVTAVGSNTLTIQTAYLVSGVVGNTLASGALVYVVPTTFSARPISSRPA